jgi:hypothetical protein
MKFRIVFLAALVTSLMVVAGCATPMSNKADVLAIKKIAIVSVSINAEMINAISMATMEPENEQVKAQRRKVFGDKDTTAECFEKILANIPAAAKEEFSAIPHWQVIPLDAVKDLPAYKAAKGDPTNQQYYVPQLIAPGTKYFNPFIAEDETRFATWRTLTALCKELDVDAVMVIDEMIAYKPAGMGFGLAFGKVKQAGTPYVGLSIAVGTKNATTAVYSRVTKDSLLASTDEVKMIQAGRVNFTGDEAEIIAAYNRAIRKNLNEQVKKIIEEMNAK